MIEDLDELLTAAVTELFSTMLQVQMARVPVEAAARNGEPHVAGAAGFAGRISGVVYGHSSV